MNDKLQMLFVVKAKIRSCKIIEILLFYENFYLGDRPSAGT